jgi:hypothetical protein
MDLNQITYNTNVEILSGKAGIFDRVPIRIGTLRMTSNFSWSATRCEMLPVLTVAEASAFG